MPESLVIELKEGTGGGGGSSPPSNTLPGGGFTPPPMEELFRGTAPTQDMLRAQQVNLAALTSENDQQKRLGIMRQQKVRLEAEWLRLHQMGSSSPVELFKQQELDQMQKRVLIQEMELKARSGWVEKTIQAEREYAEARTKFAQAIDAERQKQEKAEFGARVEKAGGGVAGYIKASLEDAKGGKSGGMAPLLRQLGGILGQQGQAAASSALGGGALGQMGGAALGAAGPAGMIVGAAMAAKEVVTKLIDAVREEVRRFATRDQAVAGLDPEKYGQYVDMTLKRIPLLGDAFADLRQQAVAVSEAYLQAARKLSMYEGTLAAAQANVEVRGITGDIRRAQLLGPELARFIDAQSRAQETQKDILAKMNARQTAADANIQEAWGDLLEKVDHVLTVLGFFQQQSQQQQGGGIDNLIPQLSAVRNTLRLPFVAPPRAAP